MQNSDEVPFPLPDDIVDRVLLSLPDLSTLSTAIQSCKAIYAVFKTHPNSITFAVAQNEYGPALPQALRLARTQQTGVRPPLYPTIPTEEEVTDVPLSAMDRTLLSMNAACVKELEGLFSAQRKDRTSLTSVLNKSESLRFTRALYRLWLVTWEPCQDAHFNGFEVEDEFEDDENNTVQQAGSFEHIFKARKRIVESFNSQEFIELYAVYSFILDLVVAMKPLYEGDFTDRAAAWAGYVYHCGPRSVLGLYNSKRSAPQSSTPLTAAKNPIALVFEERNISTSKALVMGWVAYKPILLDDILGEFDECKHCGAARGLELYNNTNWDLLKASLPAHRLCILMKGRLNHNPFERINILDALNAPSFSHHAFMQRLFEIKGGACATWTEEEWTCQMCLFGIIASHLHLWLLDWKRNNGMEIGEDCWYGYKCRTMMHKSGHAQRLNHLCDPTRDDGS